MKKQIFILALFVLAVFASVNKSYGQCTPSELTPAAGVEYTYSITNAGTSPKYDWYVTKSTDLLAAASIIDATTTTMFTVTTANQYHNTTNGASSIKITWTSASVADGGPFYLVIRYSETSSGTAACTVENLKSFEIKPINTFLLAFEGGMLSAGQYVGTSGSNTCAANITGAAVTVGSPSQVLLTYGQNTLYYVANASGLNGNWYPQIRIPALQSSQVYVSADWTSTMDGTGGWQTFGAVSDGATHDLLSSTAATASVAGSKILVRIVINNVNWQTLADQPITVGLDGFLPPTPITISGAGASKSDITAANDCTPLAAFGRTATYTINKRPTITGTPAFLGLTNP